MNYSLIFLVILIDYTAFNQVLNNGVVTDKIFKV